MKYDFYDERIIYDAPGPNLDPPDELEQEQAERTGFSTLVEIMPGRQITDAELPDRPTVRQVAAWLGKSANTIYIWTRKGLIPCKRVGKSYIFDKAALLKWARPEGAT